MTKNHTYIYIVKTSELGLLTTNISMVEYSKHKTFPNMYQLKKYLEDSGYPLKFETINYIAPYLSLTDLEGSVQ